MDFVDISMKGKLFLEYDFIFTDCQKTEKFLPQVDGRILLGPGCGYWDWFALVTCCNWATPAWCCYFSPQILLWARLCCHLYFKDGEQRQTGVNGQISNCTYLWKSKDLLKTAQTCLDRAWFPSSQFKWEVPQWHKIRHLNVVMKGQSHLLQNLLATVIAMAPCAHPHDDLGVISKPHGLAAVHSGLKIASDVACKMQQ